MSYKDRLVEPFVYQPCKNLPGMIAVPISEIEEYVKSYNDGVNDPSHLKEKEQCPKA